MAPPVHETHQLLAGVASLTSIAIPVPSGVVADSIIVVHMLKENTAAITPPAGFTQKAQAATTGNRQQTIFWKRATGADSGTYSFSWTGSVWAGGSAHRISGAITSGDPFDVFDQETSTVGASASPNVQVTTTLDDTLLLWFATATNGSGVWTQPGGFTEHYQTTNFTAASVADLVAGDTGALSGSDGNADLKNAFLGALLPFVAAGPSSAPMRTVTRFISMGARRMASVITVAAGFAAAGGDANPAAVEATATGTADNVQATIAVNPAEAAATGAADDAQISIRVNAIEATATGTADNLQASIVVNAAEATGTGTANDAVFSITILANAEVALGVGTASEAEQTNASVDGTTAIATGDAQTPQISIHVNAIEATATGVVDNATATTGTVAQAIEATGTGDGQPVTAKVASEVQAATATGDALAIHTVPQTATATGDGQQVQNINITSGIQSADATGTAHQPAVLTGALAFPQLASGTGDAEQVTITVRVNPQDIAATGTAEQPTVITGTEANAIEATGTGTAETPQARIASNVEHAASTAVAEQPQAAAASAEPQATGAAFDVTRITGASGIQSATATGDGLDATITVGGATSVTPTTATGTGDGQAITPIVGPTPQLSSGTAVAHDGQASIRVTAELITALAIAFDAEFSTGQIVSIPLLTYIFSNILTTVVDTEDTTATRSNELVMGVGV